MADPTPASGSVEERDDLGTDDAALFALWQGQEQIVEKEQHHWHRRARLIRKRYRDQRPEGDRNHRMNIFWSNVQTLAPTLYARTPKPDVQRRFKDQDDTGRLASTLLERCISFSLDNCEFDNVMQPVVQDRLLPGRGVARVMYIPHFGDEIEEDKADDDGDGEPGGNAEFDEADAAPTDVDNPGDDIAEAVTARLNGKMSPKVTGGNDKKKPLREVVYEEVVAEYVFYEDYAEGPARMWKQVPWVRFRAYMTRDELIERFGKKKAKLVNLDHAPKGMDDKQDKAPPPDIFKKARIHEYWDREKKRVIWLAPGTPDLILDDVPDPMGLPGFFPNPDPLLATTTTDTRIPVPDLVLYQDQAQELDTLTSRIDTLTRAMKVSGVYPGAEKQSLQQLVAESTENKLIPVEDWAAFSDKGGLQNMIQWMPIKEIAETLIQLYDARDRCKQILYEVTGIGDILRGMTEPDETLGAQQLKANFSTRRVEPQQKAVARFARDIIRLMGAVIAEHFSAETISAITGYPQLLPVPPVPPEPPAFLPAPPHPMGGPPQPMGAMG